MVRNLTLFIALGALALVVGCSQTDEETGVLQEALDQDFGGFDVQDEEPFFGEQTLYSDLELADEGEEEDFEADSIESAVSGEIDQDAGAVLGEQGSNEAGRWVYAVRVSWGRHVFDPSAQGVTRWDPTISTDCGRLAVRRRIALERGERVVRPRDNARSVSLISSTRPHLDGIALLLGVRPEEHPCAQQGVFRIETAERGTVEIALMDGLDNLTRRYDMGDGMQVVVLAHRLEPRGQKRCRRGTLVGRWRRHIDEAGAARKHLGTFYGRVANELGDPLGYVKGIWGRPGRGRLQSKRVFYGKFIQKDGKFLGLLAGRYGKNLFAGAWYLGPRAGLLHGGVGGQYRRGDENEPDGGLFFGRYASSGCKRRIAEEEPLNGLPD